MSAADELVRFVAIRCGIAQRRVAQLGEGAEESAVERARALELLLASCAREAREQNLAQREPTALRGRWTRPDV
jgi:hypothetical protein